MSVSRKIYKKEYLLKKTTKELHKFCKAKKIPYVGVNKKKIEENIQAWSRKKPYPNPALQDRGIDRKKIKHRITINMRRFAFEYSTQGKMKKNYEWAKRFNVASSTISKWLTWNEIKVLIHSFRDDHEKRISQKFVNAEEEVVDELLNVVKQKKNTDVKRKAINDFFGYRGRLNVNDTSGTKINMNQNSSQQQSQASLIQNNIGEMTEEEIQTEIEELEELES